MMKKGFSDLTDKHVGSRVRMRRTMLKMSQRALGAAIGVSFQQLQNYENGKNRIGASRLQQISHILGVPMAFFFEDAPDVRNVAGSVDTDFSANLLTNFVATREGASLARAFLRISNPNLRRRILDLIEQIDSK